MKIIFTILLTCFLNFAIASTYYFSSISGNDSRTPTQAQNSSTPWKTLNKLNSFFASLQPGDIVLLKRGETFYGSIIVNKSGTAVAPIVIGAYGIGTRPVVTSLVTLSGWKANSTYSGVYESDANSAFDAEVNMVLLNGLQKPIGRYPNINLPNKGYLILESHSGKTSITDNQLSSSPNWTGADVVIRTTRWTLDKGLIISHSGTKISYSAPVSYEPKNNYGYFIQNHIKTLDQLGEWYYNPSTKKLSMYFGGNNPSSYLIQAATEENLAYSASKSYIVFDNISFRGANANGLEINNGTGNYVNNCDILFSGRDGVRASGTNFKIEKCNIVNSNNDGVNVGSGSASIIKNNIIKNSYTIAGMGQSGNGNGSGVRNNRGGLVEYNKIINSGYIGVQLGGDYAIIKNNFIDSISFVKDDAGGIYTSNGSDITYKGIKIIGNIILNAIGAGAGTPNALTSSGQGIYMDDNANGIEITGNTVANCERGLFLHNSRDIIVKGNTLYNHNNGQIFMKHDALGRALRNHTITDNIFFSKLSTQIVGSFTTNVDDIARIGTLDNNYYARPMDDQVTFYNNIYYLTSEQIIYHRDIQGWKAKYGHDYASKTSAKQIAPYKLKGLVGLNKFTSGDFNSLAPKIFQNSCVVSWSNAGMLDGGYLKIVPSDEGSSIVMSIGALTAGKSYILRYSLKGGGEMSLAANLRSASYAPNTPLIRRKVKTVRTENEILFTPVTTESSASIVFTADAKTTYYLDNIHLFEANATITNPDDSIRFEYNAGKSNKTVALNGSYVDVKNNKYLNRIILKPYESAILIKNGSEKIPPTVIIRDPVKNQIFTGPATINMKAIADDEDGTISKVEFYNGSNLLVTEKYAPYTYIWKNVPMGKYTLTAKAYDNNGLVTKSADVTVSVVTENKAPTVSIKNPLNNASFTYPGTINLEAVAGDKDGSVSKVGFFIGSTELYTLYKAPYTYKWSNVPAGNYTITAKAKDNNGEITTSAAINVSVAGLPKISILRPVNNAHFTAPAIIKMEATASDPDGTISKVEFYKGSTLLATEKYAPYTYLWNNVPAGNYSLTAKAYDNSGLVTKSAGIPISVINPAAISITSPVYNELLSITSDTKAMSEGSLNNAETSGLSSFKLFPNPAISKIQVYFDALQNNQKVNLSIFDLSGRKLKSFFIRVSGKTIEIDVSSLNTGIYILNLSGENFIINKNFSKIN